MKMKVLKNYEETKFKTENKNMFLGKSFTII